MILRLTQVFVVIPSERVTALPPASASQGAPVTGAATQSPMQPLLALLQQHGWQAEQEADGLLYVSGYHGPDLDREQDTVLPHLAVLALPGSVIEGFDPQTGARWQLCWAPDPQWVEGIVRFPTTRASLQSRQTLVRVREAGEADLRALRLVSPRPVSLQEGPVLLVERERVLAFLQYHPAPEDAQAAIVTRVATRVDGRRKGYPLRLLTVLQQRFTRIWLVARLRSLERYVRQVGFTREGSHLHWHATAARPDGRPLP